MLRVSLGRLVFVILGGALAACGGKAVMDGSPNAGGSGGDGGTGTTTTTNSTTTTTSTTGGGPGCYETHDGFAMTLSTWDGNVWSCNGMGGAPGATTLQGVVLTASDGELTIDSCPPNANCMPMVSDLQYSAPGLYQNMMVGTYIEVRVAIDIPWGCVTKLEIWNLPTWGGVPNPTWPNASLWLAAVDGVAQPISQLPFTVSTTALSCYPGGQNCGVPQDDFVLHVSEAASPQNALDLAMGQSGQLLTTSSPTQDYFTVRNLRTYESGLCDDNWNYAWWAMMELMYN